MVTVNLDGSGTPGLPLGVKDQFLLVANAATGRVTRSEIPKPVVPFVAMTAEEQAAHNKKPESDA